MVLRALSLVGLFCMIALAWLASENRKWISPRLVVWAIGLQFAIGLLLLPTPIQDRVFAPVLRTLVRAVTLGRVDLQATPDRLFFSAMSAVVDLLTRSTLEGSRFVFGKLATDLNIGATVAFQVLPVIILVSALSGIGYHLGIIQAVVRSVAWLMRRSLKTSGAETFGAALLVFLGIESMTAIRAYLKTMTQSELLTIMTAFMATIAGSVMVVYAGFGAEPGHLLTASLMSAPAAILISKILVPEKENLGAAPERIRVTAESCNIVDAAARGASDGLSLALGVGAMLIAFLGIVYLIDAALGLISTPVIRYIYAPVAASYGLPTVDTLTLKGLFSVVFAPFAWVMGVPKEDIFEVARLLGTKTVLNEFLAYVDLQQARHVLSPRGYLISLYALCGFANPGSLGIVIAGLTALAPERRTDIVKLGMRAFIGGTLACFMTACVAGALVYE